METIFYRAVALSKDEISDDEKHAEIPKSSDSMFEKNPKVSELQLFFSNSMKDRVKKSKITPGNSGRKSYHQLCIAPKETNLYHSSSQWERFQYWADYQHSWFVLIDYIKEAA